MIVEVQDAVHAYFLEAKRLRHFVFSTRFEKAIINASKEQLDKLKEIVKKGELNEIKEHIETVLNGELENMTIMKLRIVAKQYGIKEYYVLTKAQLIQGIKDAQKRYAARST